jgi:hypothetical protein
VHTPQPSPIGSANGLQGGHAGTWVFSDMSLPYPHYRILFTGPAIFPWELDSELLLHSKWEWKRINGMESPDAVCVTSCRLRYCTQWQYLTTWHDW